MESRLIVILAFAGGIWTLPLGCPYNGTSYGEGETVRTEEPCLFCICQGGALECSLRVCADHPSVLPPGCFFVHKPNECCPQLFCEEESFSPVGVELRTGFKLENKLNGNDCTINGSTYAEGSAVASSEVCEYCYCVEGEMKCLKPRCLQSFEGCKAIYEKSSCCPTQYDCRDADINLLRTQIQNFVLASVESKDTNDSSTISSLETETETTHFNESVPTEEPESREEAEATSIEETTTEGTTVGAETTTPPTPTPTPDDPTTTGFQTVKTFDTTPVDVTETTTTTTVEPTTDPSVEEESKDVQIRSKSNFSEAVASNLESRSNSSQEGDDYDAYDYGEPRLPPSLPNLVIFPFVAADAVVKDDAAIDRLDVKRIDARPVFYKDYFSPPVKTEGGFVPKEPFYERPSFGEDQIEPPGGSPTGGICQSVPCTLIRPGTNFSTADKTWSKITPVGVDDVRTADFDQSASLLKSQQSKKPVTVTYKNVVVDFYPNYLITTTRARPKMPSDPGKTVTTAYESDPLEAAPSRTTTEESFFDEFLKSFLSSDLVSTTTTTTSTKHKYSSKIKSHVTEKPVRNDKPETDSLWDILVGEDGTEGPESVTRGNSAETNHLPGTIRDEVFLHSPEDSAEVADGAPTDNSVKGDAGALLKLAGCNIYGMMYRVGKVIAELSGPCLECLCTDLGVQCRSLGC